MGLTTPHVSSVKYLGLLAMSKILRTHPKSVQAHKDLVLQCLDDKDESIRLRALDLLYGMVCASLHRCSLFHVPRPAPPPPSPSPSTPPRCPRRT